MTTATDLFYRTARHQYDAGDFAAARDACAAGLAVAPDHPGLTELRGLALYELEDLGGAVHALEAATTLAPMSPAARLALADLYARFGQSLASRAIYEFLAEPDRCPIALLPDVARGLGRFGGYAGALEVCQRIVDARPGYHPAHFGAAYYLGLLGRPPEEALPHLWAAFDLAPGSLSYRVSLATVLAGVGSDEEAYRLVRDLAPDAIRCGECVRRLLPAIERVGDAELAAIYRTRLGAAAGAERSRN